MAEETVSWAIWSACANAAFLFLYVFSVSIAYVLGGYVVHPYVMAAIGYLIPYFSFTTLPFVLIAFRAINNKDIVV
jgi:hypothetical protein